MIMIAILAVGVGIGYIFYMNGFLVANAKSAQFYVESAPFGKTRNYIKAKFSSCNGVTKRVICLRGGKRYLFTFSSSMTNGTVHVEIRDKGREPVLVLNNDTPCATIYVDQRKRCYIVTKFAKADGEYELYWTAQ